MDEETTLRIEKRFNAPKQLVFDVLTKPEHIKHWSCPKGMIISSSEGEVRVGGSYKYTMKQEGGDREHTLGGEYIRIEPPDQVVYTQYVIMANGQKMHDTEISITLEEDGTETIMTFVHSGFPTKKDRDMSGMGWPSAFEKLENYLPSLL